MKQMNFIYNKNYRTESNNQRWNYKRLQRHNKKSFLGWLEISPMLRVNHHQPRNNPLVSLTLLIATHEDKKTGKENRLNSLFWRPFSMDSHDGASTLFFIWLRWHLLEPVRLWGIVCELRCVKPILAQQKKKTHISESQSISFLFTCCFKSF